MQNINPYNNFKNRITPNCVYSLKTNEIFVFGSNKAGNHASGAAFTALKQFGAKMGQSYGLQGQSFAIPTLSASFLKLPLTEIKIYIEAFIKETIQNTYLTYLVTPIGCGIANFRPLEIAPFFKGAISKVNIHLPKKFWDILI